MSDPLDDSLDLTPEEIQALEEYGVLLKPSIPQNSGKRKVSGALLSRPASAGRVSSTSSTSASVRFRSTNSATGFNLDLPEVVDSVATLEFIGFITEAATELFGRFSTRPDPDINPDGLLDYVRGHISVLSSDAYEQYSPAGALTKIGLSQRTKDAILDPQFSDMLGTGSLHFWVEDTLRINYLAVIQLLRRLKALAKRSVARKVEEHVEVRC